MSIHNSFTPPSNKSILKSASVIGLAVFCSRVLGFIRDIVIARFFGIYATAQAFVIAFKIPNLLRDLLGEGAANAAFVPVFSDYAVSGKKEDFWKAVSVTLNLLLIVSSAVTLLGILFAPVIVRIIAPGFILEPEKLKTTILLTRLLFPYIIFVSLASFFAAVLNSLKHFSVPAFTSCVLNISIIVFALIFGENILGLTLGVLCGGLLQFLMQVPVLRGKGFRFTGFLKDFKHASSRLLGKLLLPRLFSSAIYQANNFVDSIFASLQLIVGDGAVAALYFSYRLIQFPLGIFTNSLFQAILPAFSQQAALKDFNKMKETLSFGLRLTFFLMLPASAVFMALNKEIVSILFQGGRFDAYAVKLTASALFFYSIGLFAYGATKIIQAGFFALKDTVTPAKVSFFALVSNIILNTALIFPMKLAGLALATSLSGIGTFLFLLFLFKKKISSFDVKPIVVSFLRILAASVLMWLVCRYFFQINIFGKTRLGLISGLIVTFCAAIISYVVFCLVFRVREMIEARDWFAKRLFKA